MSKVKYRIREYIPKENQPGNHAWFAETVIQNEIDNTELAKKIAARTGFKAYECQAVVAAIADIVSEEVLESNRVTLANEQGVKMLSIYPKVNGSVSDADITAETRGERTVATEADLTPDRMKWVLGCTMGIKFSKQFALNKQAQKVKVTTSTAPADETPDTSGDNDNPGGNDDPLNE